MGLPYMCWISLTPRHLADIGREARHEAQGRKMPYYLYGALTQRISRVRKVGLGLSIIYFRGMLTLLLRTEGARVKEGRGPLA